MQSLTPLCLCLAVVLVACAIAPSQAWNRNKVVSWQSQNGWPANLEFMRDGSDDDVSAILDPLTQMVMLTYVDTWSSYKNSSFENFTVIGFERSSMVSDNHSGGVRALTFVQPASRRGVIAYRGTDLNPNFTSGVSDMCANARMGQVGKIVLPPKCANFSLWTLDYMNRALDFAEAVQQRYPDYDWLYTGHSLGALLAESVALRRGKLALAFSAPAMQNLLRIRTTVEPATVKPWAVVAVYHPWDPLRFQSIHQSVGAQCFFSCPAPPHCTKCQSLKGDMSHQVCRQCFQEAHLFDHYVNLMLQGQRPSCGVATASLAQRQQLRLQRETGSSGSGLDGGASERRPDFLEQPAAAAPLPDFLAEPDFLPPGGWRLDQAALLMLPKLVPPPRGGAAR